MGEAFSLDPPQEGKPRLRCPGNLKNETVRSQQTGACAFSQGVYRALRNPANHLTGDWNPVTAFQHLAAFSIVAQWVLTWEVERWYPPIQVNQPLLITKPVIGAMAQRSTIKASKPH